MSLVDELRYLLNLSHVTAWEGAFATGKSGAEPDEPGLVAAFLDPQIQAGLKSALTRHYGGRANVEVHSIFTHKTPTVQPLGSARGPAGTRVPIPGKTPVEIADLMFVRQHFVTGASHSHPLSVQGKALLLQAKRNKTPDSGDVSSGNPLTQMELYRDWPPFMGKGRLPPGPWDFKQGGPHHDFGEYLAVFDGQAHIVSGASNALSITPAFKASIYPSPNPHKTAWASGYVSPTALATDVVDCDFDFAQTLERILTGSEGVSFAPGSHSGAFDWSDFVNQMIRVGALNDYTFVSRRTNIRANTRRGQTVQAFQAIQPLLMLALAKEMRSYEPESDETGFPNYWHEPHFYDLAGDHSPFIADMQVLDSQLRREMVRDGEPPQRPPDGVDGQDDGAGHVPVMLVSSSGPVPLWDSQDLPPPRKAPHGLSG